MQSASEPESANCQRPTFQTKSDCLGSTGVELKVMVRKNYKQCKEKMS